jgi:hypothetical protein
MRVIQEDERRKGRTIPRDELDDVDLFPLLDELLPAGRVEVAIRQIEELSTFN